MKPKCKKCEDSGLVESHNGGLDPCDCPIGTKALKQLKKQISELF